MIDERERRERVVSRGREIACEITLVSYVSPLLTYIRSRSVFIMLTHLQRLHTDVAPRMGSIRLEACGRK